MLSPQSWSELISNAKRKAVTAETIREDVIKKRKAEDVTVVHSCTYDADRMAALESQVEALSNDTGAAISELHEALQKAQGMLNFCYAICQNPGIKDLADRSKASALGSFGTRSFGNRMGGAANSRPNAPHSGGSDGGGRGSAAWRPSP